jgi:protein-S-isoprenylcysteine O-methyltransferase Ste14
MAEQKDVAGVVAPPPLIFGIPLAVGIYEQTSHPVHIGPRPVTIALGIVMFGVALPIVVAAITQFRKANTAVVPFEPTTAIVDAWPYSFSRNPIYLALALIYVGISLFFNTWWPIFLMPLVLLVMQRGVIEREEAYLTRKFGDVYLEYKSRVRRWL